MTPPFFFDPEQIRQLVETMERIRRQLSQSGAFESLGRLEQAVRESRPDIDAIREVAASVDRTGAVSRLVETAQQIEASVPDVSQWLPVYAGASLPRLAQQFHDAFYQNPAFTGVFDEVTKVVEEHQQEVIEAPDEPTRWRRIVTVLRVVYPDTEATPEERTRHWVGLVYATFMLLVTLITVQQNRESSNRQLAEEIAVLTETVTQLHAPLGHLSSTPLRVTRRAVLRQGPSRQTDSLTTMPPGQALNLLMRYGRWLHVEVLNEAGEQTDLRGWIYRRNVRFLDR